MNDPENPAPSAPSSAGERRRRRVREMRPRGQPPRRRGPLSRSKNTSPVLWAAIGAALLLIVIGGAWYALRGGANYKYWREFAHLNNWIASRPGGSSPKEVMPRYKKLPIAGVTDPDLLEIHRLYGEMLEGPLAEPLPDLPRPDPSDPDYMKKSKEIGDLRKVLLEERSKLGEPLKNRVLELVDKLRARYGPVDNPYD